MQTNSSAPAPAMTHRVLLRPGVAAIAWAILSFGGFVGSFSALVWPIGQLEQMAVLAHPVTLGIWAFAWVLAGGLLALLAARLVFGRWLRVGVVAWLVLLAGAAVSAAQIATQASWTMARFGYNDPQLVGPTYLLFLVVAGVAVGGLGVQVAPRKAVWSPLVAVFGGATFAIAVMFSNVHGLADGLAPDSGLLAGSMAVSLVYIALVGTLSIAHLLRG